MTIRDALVKIINADPNVAVVASAASLYLRLILTDKTPGVDPSPPVITTTTNATALISVTALNTADSSGNTTTLGGNTLAGLPVDNNNPAQPNEVIEIMATGLGTISPTDASNLALTGQPFSYTGVNYPNVTVDDAQVDHFTADIVQAYYVPGMVGVYNVTLQLNGGVATNPFAQAYIAQSGYVSNFVTVNVLNPTTALVLDNGVLNFTYQSKSTTIPAAQVLNVTASAGALSFTVSLGNYPDGSPLTTAFVDIDTTAAVTPATITVSMDSTVLPTLAPGTYNALITVTSPAPNGPQYCQVILTVM
jgi:hypothetical protein